MEREFPARIVARLSYVGSLGRHNQIVTEGNYVTPAGHAACLAEQDLLKPPDSEYRDAQNYYFPAHTVAGNQMLQDGAPAFPAIDLVGAEGSSNYNALQVSCRRLRLTASASSSATPTRTRWTTLRAMRTPVMAVERGYNQFQPALNYGDSQYDARQRFVFAPIYITPQLHGGSPGTRP